MYPKKIPKSEKPDNSDYTIHHCHSTQEPKNWYEKRDFIRVMSIDPGKRNFCFRIEMRNLISGKITPEVYERIDLIGTLVDGRVIVDFINNNALIILDTYISLILNCDLVIIERQMATNYKMVRFSQHVITYLMVKLRDNSLKTVIMEIDSKMKTKILKAPKGLGAKEVKKWSIERALEILTLRNDQNSLMIINKAKTKKDDLADTVVQIEAVFIRMGLSNPTPAKPIEFRNPNQLFNPNNSVGLTLDNINPIVNSNLQNIHNYMMNGNNGGIGNIGNNIVHSNESNIVHSGNYMINLSLIK